MKKFIITCCIFYLVILNFQAFAIDYSKYQKCELGDLVGDDVERIHFSGYFADYHKTDFNKKQIKNFMRACLFEGVNTQYQMDCCMTEKMYPRK